MRGRPRKRPRITKFGGVGDRHVTTTYILWQTVHVTYSAAIIE
jgi:hypothetical protein